MFMRRLNIDMKREAVPGQGKQACFQEKFAWDLTH